MERLTDEDLSEILKKLVRYFGQDSAASRIVRGLVDEITALKAELAEARGDADEMRERAIAFRAALKAADEVLEISNIPYLTKISKTRDLIALALAGGPGEEDIDADKVRSQVKAGLALKSIAESDTFRGVRIMTEDEAGRVEFPYPPEPGEPGDAAVGEMEDCIDGFLTCEDHVKKLEAALAASRARVESLEAILALQNHQLAALREPKVETRTTTGNPPRAEGGA